MTAGRPSGRPDEGDDFAAPLYGATPREALSRVFRKYAVFRGRASRSEFWWWFLFASAVNVVLKIVDVVSSGGWRASLVSTGSAGDVIGYVWALGIVVPALAVMVRRLHDSGHSGFWVLGVLIPVAGPLILLALLAAPDSTAGDRFD